MCLHKKHTPYSIESIQKKKWNASQANKNLNQKMFEEQQQKKNWKEDQKWTIKIDTFSVEIRSRV